jgi:hypothetical protein
MRTQQTLTFLFWLSGAAAALSLSIFCVLAASGGKISALALVPFAWTVALGAGALQSFPREVLKLHLDRHIKPRLHLTYRGQRSLAGA